MVIGMGHFGDKIDKKYVLFIATVLGVYFFVRYFLPLVYPFLIACFIVAPLHPHLEKIEKRTRIGKGFLTTGILLLIGCIVLLAVWGAASWCIGHISEMIAGMDAFEGQVSCFISDCCSFLETHLGCDADAVEMVILERVDIFIDNLQVNIMPRLMEESVYYVKGIVSIGAFIAITFIATILLAKDYDEIIGTIKRLSGAEAILRIAGSIGNMVLTFLRAQAIIMLSISITAVLGLAAARIEGAVELGILAGLLDALPFIGTGLVLLPTAFWQLVQGNLVKAFICILVYVACALLREFLEPRLIGKRMGILPVAILASVYVGVKLYGLGGIILGPLSLLLMKEILTMQQEKTET